MALKNTNKDIEENKAEIDAVLEETPPADDAPIIPESDPENVDPNPDPVQTPNGEEAPVEETPAQEQTPEVTPAVPEESAAQKEQRYKAQQAEAQIIAERNKQLTSKVDEAAKLGEPTEEELRTFVRQDGVDWDELTSFEKSMAKKTLKADRQFALVNEAVQSANKIDQWAGEVDKFLDEADGKPEYVSLSNHEAEFRHFAMQATHRGVSMDVLLPAFLHNLPTAPKKRGDMMLKGGGGDKIENAVDGIVDAELAGNLRKNDPREYARQVKAGKIKIEV